MSMEVQNTSYITPLVKPSTQFICAELACVREYMIV